MLKFIIGGDVKVKYCSKCGFAINEGDSFCKSCGERLISGSNSNEQVNNNMNYQNNSVQMNNNVQGQDSGINFEELVNVYIGNNAYQIRKGGFSINMLFFSYFYILYRKMWLLGLAWFAGVSIVAAIFGEYASLIVLICNIVMAFRIKDIYVKYAREKVRKIVQENPGMNYAQLVTLCSAKGGTTAWPIFLIIVLQIFFISVYSLVTSDSVTNRVTSDNSHITIN